MDFWFTIEPYVYLNINNNKVLLYNTLDGEYLEFEEGAVVDFLKGIYSEENCGVLFLSEEQYSDETFKNFVKLVREKFMGDVIPVTKSSGKPIQILPYVNFHLSLKNRGEYVLYNLEYLLQSLFEVNIHIDFNSDINIIEQFIAKLPENVGLNIIYEKSDIVIDGFLEFLRNKFKYTTISLPYSYLLDRPEIVKKDFIYRVIFDHQVDSLVFESILRITKNIHNRFIFNISSFDDFDKWEKLVSKYGIDEYIVNPEYTGDNLDFFKDYIYLNKEDLFSEIISMRTLFRRHIININDFGKIHILSNGDVYANMRKPVIGNIYKNGIDEIINNEIKNGQSWLRIRDNNPCNQCLYQYICPSPSDIELAIGKENLCLIRK